MTTQEYIQRIKPTIDRQYLVNLNAKKGAVIVETRKIKDFGLIVKNHLHFLPKDWGLTVCHSHYNESFVENELSDIAAVNWLLVGNEQLDGASYNRLLTSDHFWKLIPYEKVLIFQSDSLLLRKGIEQFEHYDYIGAPWAHPRMPKIGGNGGLSIRTKQNTMDCIRSFHFNQSAHGNEDVFYSMNIKGNIADQNAGKQFSVETMYFPKPIGYHAMEKHLSKEQVTDILKQSIKEL